MKTYEDYCHNTTIIHLQKIELREVVDKYESLLRQVSFIDDKLERHERAKEFKHKRMPPN